MEDKVKTIFIDAIRDTEIGLFGSDDVSDEVNGGRLAAEIEEISNKFISEGYSITSIVPVNSGGHNYKNGIGYGYGYAYTSGVIVVGMKL